MNGTPKYTEMGRLEDQVRILQELQANRESGTRLHLLEMIEFIVEGPFGDRLLKELFIQAASMELEPPDLLDLRTDSQGAAIWALNELVAMECFERLIWLYERLPEGVTSDSDARYCYAVALHRTGQVVRSLEVFHALLTEMPEDAQLHYGTANAYRTSKEFDRAMTHYRRAIEVFDTYFDARNNLGLTLNDCGRYEEAIPFLHGAIGIDPLDAGPYVNLGESLLGLDRNQEAADAFRAALLLFNDHKDALSGLEKAQARLKQGPI